MTDAESSLMMAGPDSPQPGATSEPQAIPEHMVVLLLEGAQRFLAEAQEAIRRQDSSIRDYFINKVLAILTELVNRLNGEAGGDLVDNLVRIYDWWGREILEAAIQNDDHRLKVVALQMGEIRRSWEQVLFRGEGLSENPEF